MNPRSFGIGILGTGIMGRRMLAALQRNSRFRVVALWDPDPSALLTALATAAGARAAASVADLVNDPQVDLVYIASPPSMHLAGVQAALAAGRACLCEKPLAHDVAEAQAVQALVAASGLPFAVNFPFARSVAARRLIELVHGGSLGTIQGAAISLRFAQWPRPWQAGASAWLAGPEQGGFTREVLSHFVFLAQRLFGPAAVADVQLTRAPGQAESALRARLVHAGVTVRIDAAVAGDVADANRFEVVGSLATAALSQWSRIEYQGQTSEPADSSQQTLDALAAMLEGRADHGLANVDEAAAVVRSIETLLQP